MEAQAPSDDAAQRRSMGGSEQELGFHIPQAVRAALRTLEDRLQCDILLLEDRLRRDFFVGAAGSSAPPSGTLQRDPVGDVERGR